jgi:hypothetical protein
VTSFLVTPPRWPFHLMLLAPTLAVLYAWSFAGTHFVLAVFAGYALAAAALVWFLRFVGHLVMRWRRSARGNAWWFVIAPLGAAAVGVLLWFDAPLRVRWAGSRGAFERVAQQVIEGDRSTEVSEPFDRRLGLYRVASVWRVKNGVLFYDSVGSLSNDAGFAYLPDGPSPRLENGLFESPQFRPLGGGWYAWAASW